ncbi:MAG: FliH/SctL family protein [Nitrospirales bacterium]
MKSKWSKVIKTESRLLPVESFEMAELIPFFPGYVAQRRIAKEEEPEVEPEVEPPHDCSVLQEQAFKAGRETGIQEGISQCQHEVDLEMQRVFQLAEQLGQARSDMVVKVEADLLELAFVIARKVIQREVSTTIDIVTDRIQTILKDLSATSGVHLKVHPDEVEHIQDRQARFVGRDGNPLAIRIEGDEAVSLGGCSIHTDGLDIDATIEQQLHILHEAVVSQKESHGPHPSSSLS